MKNYFLIVLILTLLSYRNYSQTFSGVITEVNSKVPISYASIGIMNTNSGTVANNEGYFSINISKFSENDTLRISAIGYENLDFLIKHCRSFIKLGGINLELNTKVNNIDEITITASKTKTIKIGNDIKASMIFGRFQDKNTGAEIGTVLKYQKKKKGQVKSFNINLHETINKYIPFRINLYSMKNGLPHKNILKKPIYTKGKIVNGYLSIDVSDLNIYIKGDSFLSIELIENINTDGILFKAGYLKSKTYYRAASQDQWKKAPLGVSIWSEVTYRK
jgi:hypothetical protein